MAAKRPQTMAKRAREQAVKERRDRKRAKKADAAARRAAGKQTAAESAPQADSAGDPEETDASDFVEEARATRL